MEGENLFWTRTPPKTKSNYHERGRAARKDESSLFIQGEKSVSEKEIKREKNPDAGFKITEQILSICLAHLILCCIEETVMDKVNPASPSGCVLAWTELRTVTHSRETHTHTQSPTSSPNLFNHMQVSSFLPDGALFGGTHRTRVRLANQKQVVGSGPRRGFESAYARGKLGFLFAQADYECTQLGWVWLNENLFNSAARNPGLQVKTMFWFTFRGNLMNAALFSPCSQISISSGEAQSCQKSPEWWVSSDVNE